MHIPDTVSAFLDGDGIAVVGVSRNPRQFSRAVYRKLAEHGGPVFPVNPRMAELDGAPCYPDVAAIPAPVESVMVVAPPSVAADVVRQCAERDVTNLWLHRSFGPGSVSDDAVAECAERGINCIVGGCPMMYCAPVDLGHRCMRWLLARRHRVPA